MEAQLNQPRLSRCPRCGELKGEASIADRYEGIVRLPVICICRGVPCPQCGKRLIRRPISNHYNEPTGTVRHTPWFGYLKPCPTCRRSATRRLPQRVETPLNAEGDTISHDDSRRLLDQEFVRKYDHSHEPKAAER